MESHLNKSHVDSSQVNSSSTREESKDWKERNSRFSRSGTKKTTGSKGFVANWEAKKRRERCASAITSTFMLSKQMKPTVFTRSEGEDI